MYKSPKNANLSLLQFESKLKTKPTVTSNKELAEEFLEWKKSYTKSAYEKYRNWVFRFQEFVDCPPEEMQFVDYVNFINHVTETGRFAPMNIRYGANIIHNYLKFYAEQGRLGFPMMFVRTPKARAESHYCVTEREFRRLLDALDHEKPHDLRTSLMLRLLHDTGVRVGELLSLDVGDISDESSAIIETEKTIRQRRVFWTTETDQILRRYLKIRTQMDSDSEALFIGGGKVSRKRYLARGVQRIIRQVCGRAEIENKIVPHSFRHAFIRRMSISGINDAVVAELVGHSTPHTIAHYTNLSDPELEAFYRKGTPESVRIPSNSSFADFAMSY